MFYLTSLYSLPFWLFLYTFLLPTIPTSVSLLYFLHLILLILFIYLFIHLFICLFIYLFVLFCIFILLTLFILFYFICFIHFICNIYFICFALFIMLYLFNLIFFFQVDGRSRTAVRPLTCSPDVLPSVHGSSFFQRGDTHVLCTTTLGTRTDAKTYFPINGAKEEKNEMFYLHYDFPPYCTGETGTFFYWSLLMFESSAVSPIFFSFFLPSHLLFLIPSFLPSFLPSYLPTYFPSFLLFYNPSFLPNSLPVTNLQIFIFYSFTYFFVFFSSHLLSLQSYFLFRQFDRC